MKKNLFITTIAVCLLMLMGCSGKPKKVYDCNCKDVIEDLKGYKYEDFRNVWGTPDNIDDSPLEGRRVARWDSPKVKFKDVQYVTLHFFEKDNNDVNVDVDNVKPTYVICGNAPYGKESE